MDARKRHFNFSISYSFEGPEDGEEIEVDVDANVEPYHPAKLHGPPEDCYPAEGGECDDWQISHDGHPITDAEFEDMGGSLEALKTKVELEAAEWEPDVPERDPRDDYDDPD